MITEPLIFEISGEGKRAVSFPKCDVPEKPLHALIPQRFIRRNAPALPQVSEMEVVRHFTRLSQQNFSEDTHFYPLGSCTMKYNPRVNEMAAALPRFQNLHPYQPDVSAQGTLELLWKTEQMFCELTGMDAFTLHPAAGAHGEFTALLMVKAYFESKGEKRTRVIVPDTAHGTNPASAALAGFTVQSFASNKRGRVDIEALKTVLGADTALVMITCPNTLGLFEDEIIQISEVVHAAGALMYMDGANFNALVGLAEPAKLGFDVMHLNLHKTFAVPHGGGGPGSGPVGVKKFLEPFLPAPRVTKDGKNFRVLRNTPKSIGQVRNFFGNVGAVIRAYTYILSLGEDGLRSVSENSLISANYMMAKLKPYFKPFIDEPCMHECVLSGAESAKEGLRTLDIVKRLLDLGYYAPTIYFPLIVPEAMMVEPTETESKRSMDGFVEALRTILEEYKSDPEMVKNAPHTMTVKRLDEVTAARTPVLKWPPQRS